MAAPSRTAALALTVAAALAAARPARDGRGTGRATYPHAAATLAAARPARADGSSEDGPTRLVKNVEVEVAGGKTILRCTFEVASEDDDLLDLICEWVLDRTAQRASPSPGEARS